MSKKLICLENLHKMQRKIQFHLFDAILIGTFGHGLNYLRVN